MNKISNFSTSIVAPEPTLLIAVPDPGKQARFAGFAYSGKVYAFILARRVGFLKRDLEFGKVSILDWKREWPRLNLENLTVCISMQRIVKDLQQIWSAKQGGNFFHLL